ncbi:MAG: hypothetical protein JWR09_3606, partial [Mucilaginibacter sp.]|nr:hypothetical protein [Mucilaginibacter sp.]
MRPIAIKILTIILFAIAGVSFGYAQPSKSSAKITGALLDEKGKPMDYATVTLLNAADSSVVKGTLSNDAGTYAFDHINTGT